VRTALLRALWLLAVAAALVVCGPIRAQAVSQGTEYAIKAAFVCKFGSYVEWPPEAFERPDSPLTIAVLGSSLVLDEMTRAAAEHRAGARPIVVQRIGRGGESLAGVHILFVARSHGAELPEALAAAKDSPVLIVTERDETLPPGSMINFVVEEDRVRFDIDAQVAELRRLKISARLLALGRRVTAKPA
jgi:hypothetical protein